MSMSIYAMNYNSGLTQNQLNSTKSATEKERGDEAISMSQHMKGTEAYRQVKEGRENSGETENASGGQIYSGAVRMDTAVISEEGRRACSETGRKEEEMNQSRETVVKEAAVEEKQDTVSGEGEYKIEDLSEYTDTELKQMYYRGEITLQEYEDETGEVLE